MEQANKCVIFNGTSKQMHYIEWNKLTNALYLMEQANKCVIFK